MYISVIFQNQPTRHYPIFTNRGEIQRLFQPIFYQENRFIFDLLEITVTYIQSKGCKITILQYSDHHHTPSMLLLQTSKTNKCYFLFSLLLDLSLQFVQHYHHRISSNIPSSICPINFLMGRCTVLGQKVSTNGQFLNFIISRIIIDFLIGY